MFGSLIHWNSRFIWDLVVEIWDLNEFIFEKKIYKTKLRSANYIKDTTLVYPAGGVLGIF